MKLFIYLFIYSFIHFWLVFKKHCNQFGFHKKVSLQDFVPIFQQFFEISSRVIFTIFWPLMSRLNLFLKLQLSFWSRFHENCKIESCPLSKKSVNPHKTYICSLFISSFMGQKLFSNVIPKFLTNIIRLECGKGLYMSLCMTHIMQAHPPSV